MVVLGVVFLVLSAGCLVHDLTHRDPHPRAWRWDTWAELGILVAAITVTALTSLDWIAYALCCSIAGLALGCGAISWNDRSKLSDWQLRVAICLVLLVVFYSLALVVFP